MQALCGLQGVFLLFNCQTPERAGHVLEEWRAQKNLRREQEQAADSESTSGTGAGRKALSARILAGIALAVVVFFYLIQGY